MLSEHACPLVADPDHGEALDLSLRFGSLLEDLFDVSATPLWQLRERDSPKKAAVRIHVGFDLLDGHVRSEVGVVLDVGPRVLDGELVGVHLEALVLDLVIR